MRRFLLLSIFASCASFADSVLPNSENLSVKAQLGQKLFFDTNLSEPAGQACASCHNPDFAFTDADKTQPTSKGVDTTLHGNRNAPTAMYMAYSPAFHFNRTEGLYMGGQFFDGRAATLEDQAKGPFLNPVEMANPNAEAVVKKVKVASYASQFDTIYGNGALNDTEQAYDYIANAIAEFERSAVFNRFSSKYDFYLFGKAAFTAQERRGLAVFEGKGNCAACHPNRPQSNGAPPLFTDFSYDNIGVPKNPESPFYTMSSKFNPDGEKFVDLGLGGHLNISAEDGKFKVPTLRNIALTSPYTHNGYFTKLRNVVEFYNTRKVKRRCAEPLTNETQSLAQKCWAAPEVSQNVNFGEMGNLKLSERDIDDLVAFLETLTDGYDAKSPWNSLASPEFKN
ncbi:MAG: cytochrome c peroxidase [Methylococcales bacterium]|nr:cytochrome c peroxidase [Methylococcales bacterium]